MAGDHISGHPVLLIFDKQYITKNLPAIPTPPYEEISNRDLKSDYWEILTFSPFGGERPALQNAP
jgi:hypothetical protein